LPVACSRAMDDESQSYKDLILRFCVRVSEGRSFTEYEAEDVYRAARAVEATLDVTDEPGMRERWVYLLGQVKAELDAQHWHVDWSGDFGPDEI